MIRLEFPDVDIYFPSCFYSAMESYLKFMGRFDGIKKIYPFHMFRYIPPASHEIGFAGNGTDLNMLLESDYEYAEMEGNLGKYYGVKYEADRFTTYAEFKADILASLEAKKPRIIQFSMGYIKERRHYRQVFGQHIITIIGYNPGDGSFIAMEQGMGTINISSTDMEDCFHYQLESFGDAKTFSISGSSSFVELKLAREDLIRIADRNLDNFLSDKPNLGIKGLRSFNGQLRKFLEANSKTAKPFAIPGLWQFSHERKALKNWLEEVGKDLPFLDKEFLLSFSAHLEKCFKQWLQIDYLIEKCIKGRNPAQLAGLPELFEDVFALESASIPFWSKLKELASNHA